jgi:hypothetical protein
LFHALLTETQTNQFKPIQPNPNDDRTQAGTSLFYRAPNSTIALPLLNGAALAVVRNVFGGSQVSL